jgi:hypothetical protein
MDRVQAPRWEGVGLRFPERNPAHEDPQWFELDLDDEFEDPDVEPVDPLPTERHRQVPD